MNLCGHKEIKSSICGMYVNISPLFLSLFLYASVSVSLCVLCVCVLFSFNLFSVNFFSLFRVTNTDISHKHDRLLVGVDGSQLPQLI